MKEAEAFGPNHSSGLLAVALVAAMVVTPLASKLGTDSVGLNSRAQPSGSATHPGAGPALWSAADPARTVAWRLFKQPDTPPRRVPALLVRVTRDMQVRARPTQNSPVIGVVPSGSKYYRIPTTAWIQATSGKGQWGLVQIPYVSPRNGWIPLNGLKRAHTWIEVHVNLSAHRVTVTKAGRRLFSFLAAIGAPSSPTPPGRYFVSDRIPFWRGSALGSFAFGISGIQPRLPAGWTGGNQLAIHGTNDPALIGTSSSAGCVRVSERALALLEPLLQLGTPVIITG